MVKNTDLKAGNCSFTWAAGGQSACGQRVSSLVPFGSPLHDGQHLQTIAGGLLEVSKKSSALKTKLSTKRPCCTLFSVR